MSIPSPESGAPSVATPEPSLVGTDLGKRYGDRFVLDIERVELHPGEVFAILGPNGSGKSTLMRILAMLEPPSRGRVTVDGKTGKAAERHLRRTSAVVFQRPHFWSDAVAYNVGLGLRLRGVSQIEAGRRVEAVCEALGLRDLLDLPVAELSGGQAQRVALARALVLEPEILFLDEPTANLDSEARAELREDLETVARDGARSVLLITHDRNEAFRLADRIGVLRDGRFVQTGTAADIYENPADSYIARLTGAELTIAGRVVSAEGRMLEVDTGGARLVAVGKVAPGSAVKIAYRPEDLVLTPASAPAREMSTRNLLYATVTERRELGGLVRLRLQGPFELVALVTRNAAQELELEPGQRVSVRMKATALHAYPARAGSVPAAGPPEAGSADDVPQAAPRAPEGPEEGEPSAREDAGPGAERGADDSAMRREEPPGTETVEDSGREAADRLPETDAAERSRGAETAEPPTKEAGATARE